jgi:hypothetical protein
MCPLPVGTRGCIQTFPDWADNEIYAYLWYYSLISNRKGYGNKNHYTDSQNSDTTAPSGWELYHLQFSLQAASPETFGYTVTCIVGLIFSFLDFPCAWTRKTHETERMSKHSHRTFRTYSSQKQRNKGTVPPCNLKDMKNQNLWSTSHIPHAFYMPYRYNPHSFNSLKHIGWED